MVAAATAQAREAAEAEQDLGRLRAERQRLQAAIAEKEAVAQLPAEPPASGMFAMNH